MISDKGMEEELYKTIRVVDEDALMAALYEGKLTEEEIDEMYPQKVVWALVMNKK
jgi:predicted RNA-binding protein associated with RNAse of E/G family